MVNENFEETSVFAASPEKVKQEDSVETPGLLGEKRLVREGDLARYGGDLVRIFKLGDAVKRTKANLIAAQAAHEASCSEFAQMKERLLMIFNELED